jgi:hypothetical protein
MILIGKRLLTEYINKHPDAETHLLLWLKEFGIKEQKFHADRQRFLKETGQGIYGLGFGGSTYQLGNSKYCITTLRSSMLQTHIIEFVGTAEKLEAIRAKEQEQVLIDNSDIKVKEVTFTTKGLPRKKATPVSQLADGTANNIEDLNPYHHAFDHTIAQEIKSIEDYKAALSWVEGLFVKNNVSDLEILLPIILALKAYEEIQVTFSELKPLDVIKLKMEHRFYHEYPSVGLLKLAGGPEELKAYLAGEKPFTNRKLKAFYRYLKVPFEVD